jgi:hypothetical protein
MGATMGILALFNGFAIEAATVWWGVRGYRQFSLFKKQPVIARLQ